ncbi:hypothetical protein OH76DRAFT_459977 [Lentinus brumalis]|uniref:Uncharacterized protein n=1 Tax=Lentinus brumalis TaxID=2498619 RepID=A0A371CII8_9APHY|nr:hypothetical protein OH76DRAFT_459977 [Polyporus brumalis]
MITLPPELYATPTARNPPRTSSLHGFSTSWPISTAKAIPRRTDAPVQAWVCVWLCLLSLPNSELSTRLTLRPSCFSPTCPSHMLRRC